MKLLIISHTPHYYRQDKLVGWGPTVREIDQLTRIFDEILHIAPLYPQQAPSSSLSYESGGVKVIPVRPAGGAGWAAKLDILRAYPSYYDLIRRHLPQADAVHVRCPSNISLLALLILTWIDQPAFRWAKYAGNWQPKGRSQLSYDLQRWWLRQGFHHGPVTVNGEWSEQPQHVFSFNNPSLSAAELEEGALAAEIKSIGTPVKLLYVGRLENEKGTGRLLQIARKLKHAVLPFRLDLIGDGPDRAHFEKQACALSLDKEVLFHGWMPVSALSDYYKQAHLLILPTSASEGWPKVLSEGMAYGVVPIAGAVSSIPAALNKFECGVSLPPDDIEGFAQAIWNYVKKPERWRDASQAGLRAARLFTYDAYLNSIQEMLHVHWGIETRLKRVEGINTVH